MNFIEELYYGNINPNEKRIDRNPRYAEAMKMFCEKEDKLTRELSGNKLRLLNELINASDEMVAYAGVENFRLGFLLGVQLMTECFNGALNNE